MSGSRLKAAIDLEHRHVAEGPRADIDLKGTNCYQSRTGAEVSSATRSGVFNDLRKECRCPRTADQVH
jgi:hypothetical protein